MDIVEATEFLSALISILNINNVFYMLLFFLLIYHGHLHMSMHKDLSFPFPNNACLNIKA